MDDEAFGLHVHACPECYEDEWCNMDCSLWWSEDGRRGSTTICSTCEKQAQVNKQMLLGGDPDGKEAGW